jgi:hypothetical protein
VESTERAAILPDPSGSSLSFMPQIFFRLSSFCYLQAFLSQLNFNQLYAAPGAILDSSVMVFEAKA